MLKISIHHGPLGTNLELIGRLAGPWVNELKRFRAQVGTWGLALVSVDLSDVTFIDEDGKALLLDLWRDGATFQVAGCLNRWIVEEITQSGRDGRASQGQGEHKKK
jgi:ABC-type transporter Mla MlaB component